MTDYNQEESPDAIRADIERTRAEMGAKIDQIGERLSPEQLRQQAQESMNEMMTDTANRVSTYVRDHRRELSDNLVHTLKHNPLPTALIGLGLGWLLVESFSTSSDEDDYGDRYARRRRAQYARAARSDYGYASGSYDPRYGTGYYRGSVQAGDSYPYQENYYGGYPYSEGYDEGYGPEFDANYDERTYEDWYGAESFDSTSEQGSNGRNIGEGMRERSRQMRDRAEGMAHEAGHQAQQMGENIRHGAEEAVDRTRETFESAGSQVRDMGQEAQHQAAQAGRQMRHQTAQAGRQMRRQTMRAGRQMGRQAGRAGRYMGREARVVGRQVERSLEDNPMTFGILAFGAGLALSLLLPETRIENRTMGRISDQVKESGYEMAQDAAQRAQHVYEEVRPELEQTARKVGDDLKETARSAQQDMQGTLDKAKQEAKAEAEAAKGKAQSEAGKVTQTAKQETGTSSSLSSSSSSQSNTPTSTSSSTSGNQSSNR